MVNFTYDGHPSKQVISSHAQLGASTHNAPPHAFDCNSPNDAASVHQCSDADEENSGEYCYVTTRSVNPIFANTCHSGLVCEPHGARALVHNHQGAGEDDGRADDVMMVNNDIYHAYDPRKPQRTDDRCRHRLAPETKDDDDEVVFEENDAYGHADDVFKDDPMIFEENDAYGHA